MHRVAIALIIAMSSATCFAQAERTSIQSDDVTLDDYLRMLEVISPAARSGAEAYMAAYSHRCGRALKTIELRRAVAEDSGDPVLLDMIRASYYRDTAQIQRLSANVTCRRG